MSGKQFILLSYRYLQEDDQIASICDELGLASYGKSIPVAEQGLDNAISAVLNTLTERGQISEYLKERGITVFQHEGSYGSARLALPGLSML
jgi:predicted RNase H-like HicB family nuclease